MTKLVQILLLFVLQWLHICGKPILFQGISFRKNFDLSFKPLSILPLTFIKEKWSPLGVFGKKHTIMRRDLGDASQDVSISQVPKSIILAKDEQSYTITVSNIEGTYVPNFHKEMLLQAVAAANSPEAAVAPVFEETEPITVAPLVGAVGIAPASPQVLQSPPVVAPQPIPPPHPVPIPGTVSPTEIVLIEQPILEPQPAVEPPVIKPAPPIPEPVPPVSVDPIPPTPVSELLPTPELQPVLIEPVVPTQPVAVVQPVQTVVVTQPVPVVPDPVIEPVIAPPLPPVPIIVPPGVVESISNPPKLVPLVVDKPSIPGSVMLPPGYVQSSFPRPLETVPREILMQIQPPIGSIMGAIPALQNIRSQDLMTGLFRVAPSILLNSPLGNRLLPPIESNSILEIPKGQNESTFVRGSKVALHFGNILFQLMSQFFSNARLTLDQMTNPSPIYLN